MRKVGKILLGGVLAVSLAFNVATLAAATYEKVEATIDYELKMQLNGVKFEPKENDGSLIRPLMYKGRTFLPVAALGKALDIPVGWDGETRTVIIGSTDANPEIDLTQHAVSSATEKNWIIKSQDDLKINGDSGYAVHDSGIACTLYGFLYDHDRMTFSTCGRDTLTFTAWTDGNKDVSVCVYDENNNVIDKFDLKANQLQERTISIKGLEKISFGRDCDYFTQGTLKILDPIVYNK